MCGFEVAENKELKYKVKSKIIKAITPDLFTKTDAYCSGGIWTRGVRLLCTNQGWKRSSRALTAVSEGASKRELCLGAKATALSLRRHQQSIASSKTYCAFAHQKGILTDKKMSWMVSSGCNFKFHPRWATFFITCWMTRGQLCRIGTVEKMAVSAKINVFNLIPFYLYWNFFFFFFVLWFVLCETHLQACTWEYR